MTANQFDSHLTPIGIHRVGLIGSDATEDIDRETCAMLARTLNTGNVLGFIGSGVSSGLGYPSWDDMLQRAVEYVLLVAQSVPFARDILRDGETALLLIDFLAKVTESDARIGESLPDVIQKRLKTALAIKGDFPEFEAVCNDLCPGCDRSILEVQSTGKTSEKRRVRAEQKIVVAECCRKSMERMAQGATLPDNLPSIDDVLRAQIFECGRPGKHSSILDTLYTKLGIRRFLTTNYDLQIETSCFGLDPRSERNEIGFTYDPRDMARLVEFGFGHKQGCRVMHLHGMLNDPAGNPLIFAERDYQRIYLREDPTSRLYRESFESILEAHPILFVGIGMREEDILRPFRRFLTDRRPGEVQRPLFALIPADATQNPAERAARRRFFYSRHGVKVLYYPVPGADPKKGSTVDRRTKALEAQIGELELLRQRWWHSWRRKPLMRRRHPESSFIHGNSYDHGNGSKWTWDWPVEHEYLLSKSAVFVVGRTGAGKGGLAYDLARAAQESPSRPVVVANITFTNDFLNVLEQVIQYLGHTRKTTTALSSNHPVEQFFDALDQSAGHAVCILGGFDRVLYRRGSSVAISPQEDADGLTEVRVPLGDPVDADIERFLTHFIRRANSGSRGTLVVTANVCPAPLVDANDKPPVSCLPLARGVRSLAHSLLTTPLDHHVFALKTIESFDKHGRLPDGFEAELERRMTSMGPQHRPMQVVPALLKAAGKPGEEHLLETLSYFHAPVHASVVEHISDAECGGRKMAEELADLGLLIRTRRDEDQYVAFNAHPVTRLYFSHKSGRISDTTHEPHMFTMSVYAHDNNENVFHSEHAHSRAVEILESIMDRAEELVRSKSDRQDAVPFIRSAFNLLRYNWSAVTVPRWAESARAGHIRATPSAYDSYQQYLTRLHNLVRDYTGERGWDPNDESGAYPLARWDESGALYANELSWLYNESGTAAYCAGETTDALTHYRSSQIVNQESGSAENTYHFLATELNIALTELDRGRLNYARERLSTLARHSGVMRGDLGRTIGGYFGIISFYQGDRERAIEKLTLAIEEDEDEHNEVSDESASTASVRYKRRTSIFLRFRSNLYLVEKNDQARRDLDRSLALAQAANQPDLVYANHVTRSRVHRILGDQPESWDLLARCHEFAWRLGSKRLEIDVRIQQAETALAQGNSELTAQFANRGLVLSTAYGLGLRKTNCMVLLAGALLNQNDTAEALTILTNVKSEAKRQGYQHMLQEIDILETKARSAGRPSLLLL